MKHAHSNRRQPNGRRGFTIVEVLLAMLIMGLMFASITQLMTAARKTRDSIHNMQESQLAGPAVLDMIELDLRALFTHGLPRASWLKVQDRVVAGLDADRIDFVTSTDSLVGLVEAGELPVRADYNEVGYCLRTNPRNDEFLEIYRREDFGIDDEPFDGGEYTYLADQVKSFLVEVFPEDGKDVDPLTDWDSGSSEAERAGLPAAIKLTLVLELKPRIDSESLELEGFRKRTVEYTRWVRLPEDLRFAAGEFPRLVIPPAPSTPGDPAQTENPGGTPAGGAPANNQAGGKTNTSGYGPGQPTSGQVTQSKDDDR